MNVHLRQLIVGTQLVIPDMVAAGRGRIINVTSGAGVHRWPPIRTIVVAELHRSGRLTGGREVWPAVWVMTAPKSR
jgi:NAD(P)-dependent dehydrogenase (short-subunit alcohol dehydrogenase family)